MDPYYSDDLVTLYQGDSLDILPTIPAGSINACVTDPPYVIGAVSAGNIASKSGGWADRGVPDVWRHKTGGHKPNGHPAEKPVGLVSRILTTTGLGAGAHILEPFGGSGTTAIAAKALGMRCTVIEAEEKWCELIASRLDQGVLDFGDAS